MQTLVDLAPAGVLKKLDQSGALGDVREGLYYETEIIAGDTDDEKGFTEQNLNGVCINTNNIASRNGKVCYAYYKTRDGSNNIPLFISVRDTDGTLTEYDTGLYIAVDSGDSDEHRMASIAFDSTGKLWLVYGIHAENPLSGGLSRAYHTTASLDSSTPASGNWTAVSSFGGNDTQITYPMFTVHPVTGALYFTYRDGGSGNGDQYIKVLNTGDNSWSAITGSETGLRAGRIINGKATPVSAYLNGLPKWDANNHLWFQWQWYTSGDPGGQDQMAMRWDGTSFYKLSGAAQTIPATVGNCAALYSVDGSLYQIDQNHFHVTRRGTPRLYVAAFSNDDNGKSQLYCYTGASGDSAFTRAAVGDWGGRYWIDGATYSDDDGFTPPVSVLCGDNGDVYLIHAMPWGPDKGFLVHVSFDKGVTWRRSWLPHRGYHPNLGVNLAYDDYNATGVAKFLIAEGDDPNYGVTYVDSGTYGYGARIAAVDWVPGITSLVGGLGVAYTDKTRHQQFLSVRAPVVGGAKVVAGDGALTTPPSTYGFECRTQAAFTVARNNTRYYGANVLFGGTNPLSGIRIDTNDTFCIDVYNGGSAAAVFHAGQNGYVNLGDGYTGLPYAITAVNGFSTNVTMTSFDGTRSFVVSNAHSTGTLVSSQFGFLNAGGTAIVTVAGTHATLTSRTAGSETAYYSITTKNGGTAAERLRVAADGKVGMNLQGNAPGKALTIAVASATDDGIELRDGPSSTVAGARLTYNTSTDVFRIDSLWDNTSNGGGEIRVRTNGTPLTSIKWTGNSNNVGLVGGNSFGNGEQVISIANAVTVPNANPTGGGILFVDSGALKYRGSSGTVTTIAPA